MRTMLNLCEWNVLIDDIALRVGLTVLTFPVVAAFFINVFLLSLARVKYIIMGVVPAFNGEYALITETFSGL